MKRTMIIMTVTVVLAGSLVLYAAEGQDTEPRTVQQQAVKNLLQGQKPNQQQRLGRFMDEINKAYEAKNFQRISRLIQRYANVQPNLQTPDGGRKMRQQQQRMNQQQKSVRQQRDRDERPQAQAMQRRQQRAARDGRPFQNQQMAGRRNMLDPQQPKGRNLQTGRRMRPQQPQAERPAPYAQRGRWGALQDHRFAGPPRAFGQSGGGRFRQRGPWNADSGFSAQRHWGSQRPYDFRADEF